MEENGFIYIGYDQKGLFKIGMTGDYKKILNVRRLTMFLCFGRMPQEKGNYETIRLFI